MRIMPLALLVALALHAPAAAAEAPPPIEGELFDSWIGKYRDLTTDGLLKKLGLTPPSAPAPLPFSPAKAKFYDRVTKALALSKEARALLEKDGLVVVPQKRSYSMAAAYYEIYTKDLPLLVTTDSILDAMHRSFDAILAELEETVLRDALEAALRKVHNRLQPLVKATPALSEAAQDLDLYLTLALNLLESDPDRGHLLTAPRLVAPAEVEALLAKVAGLVCENPDFGRPGTNLYGSARAIDWSQFKPRGHYTASDKLARYFRAMMWLGRADTGFHLEKARELRAASLFTALLSETGADKDLAVLGAVVDLMVGRSDDLGPAELAPVLARLKLAAPDALVGDDAMKRLGAELAALGLGQQRIRSQLVVSPPSDPRKVAPPATFQLFGQRFILDSFVLSKVVYDDILWKGDKVNRRMPTGLDVMAALGNPTAVELLAGGELEAWHYAGNIAALVDVVASYSPERWRDSLYDRWLDALRSLSSPPPPSKFTPAMMARPAWAAKMLQTQLASWAQLRHDTILYAKQSYTASIGCLYPKGYVEPYPVFYRKLGDFARDAEARLGDLGKALGGERVKRYRDYFANFAGVMQRLAGMADKELRGQAFDGTEERFLRDTIEMHLDGVGYAPEPDWTGWYVGLVFVRRGDDDLSAILMKPTIADVHTDPDADRVLEVGTGNADFLVAAIDNDGDRAIHVGPTFSYYEFTVPSKERMTDEEWTARLGAEPVARPGWITPWVAP